MLEGVRGVDKQVFSFARLFLWTTIPTFLGERFRRSPHRPSRGRERAGRCNDAVVVLTKQHAALEDVSRSLVLGDHFFAFLRHLCGVKTWEGRSHPRSSGSGSVEAFWDPDPSRKEQVWNRARIRPDVCDSLERVAQVVLKRHAPGRERQEASRKHEEKSSV